jgi:hypothetical protein
VPCCFEAEADVRACYEDCLPGEGGAGDGERGEEL